MLTAHAAPPGLLHSSHPTHLPACLPPALPPSYPPNSVELVRWSRWDKACQKAVGQARSVFKSAFCERGRGAVGVVLCVGNSPELGY